MQGHALIFAFGEALQTIDMNQDGCLAEALKTRNLLAVGRGRGGGGKGVTLLRCQGWVQRGTATSPPVSGNKTSPDQLP